MKSDVSGIALDPRLLESLADINTLEEACLEFSRMVFIQVIEMIDKALQEQVPKGWKCVGKRKRTICTRLGEISITRRLYVKATKSKEQKGRFLLDETLNIRPRRRVTHGLLKLMVSLSTRLPFREVAAILAEAGFPALSHGTIHKEVRYYGELQMKQMERMRDKLFVAGQTEVVSQKPKRVPVLFVEADGVMVGCQRGKRRKMEIKLGVVHEGWREEGKVRRLKNPQVMLGLFSGGDDFWECFSAQLARSYNLDETLIVVNGDGAAWIQEKVKEYFPEAIVQLDRFHLIRDLYQVVGRTKAKKLLAELDKGNTDVFLDTLEAMEPTIEEKKLQSYRELYRLCRHYRDHLPDYRVQLGTTSYQGVDLHGMGIAENMVDKKVANRMKKRGMYWSETGAWAMACLLALKSNGELFRWLDEHKEMDILNPVQKLSRRQTAADSIDTGQWLQVDLPALSWATRHWVTALRNLSNGYAIA